MMRRSRVPIVEKRILESKTNHNSSQRKAMPSDQKVMRRNFSVSMVNTRSAKESKTKVSAVKGQTVPAKEIVFETPDQSCDEVERKTTELTPMPNAKNRKKKTIEFSSIDIVDDTTSNTPETMKDDSQTKRTSFTERIAMMVGMKPREKEEIAPTTEKGKTFGTVSAITTEDNRDDDQVELVATANHEATVKNGAIANQEKTTSLELCDLMAKLEQIDKKLKYSEEDRQTLKKEIRYNKSESLDNCFNLARATEEKLQQMSDKVEATDKEREKNIKKDMQEMKQRYDNVNSKLGGLEMRIVTKSRDHNKSSCAIQSKLNAILRNSTSQDKLVTDRTQGNRVDFVEPPRNKRESTPLPRGAASIGPGGGKTIMKSGTSNTTNGPGDSTTSNNEGPDAMTWASTWEMMNRTLEAFATRNNDSSERGGGKTRKTFKKPKEIKDDSDGCIDTWIEVMRLHLEQDNLNDERQACTAILSNLEGTALNV